MNYFMCGKCGGSFDPSYTYCPNCDGQEVMEQRAEIIRLTAELNETFAKMIVLKSKNAELTAELEQTRERVKKVESDAADISGLWFDTEKRAEAAEQQVVALVEIFEKFRISHAADKIIDEVLSTLPDRAKKIQAVLEASDELEICIGDMAAIEEGEEHFSWEEIQKTEQAYADAVKKFGEAVRARWNDKTSRDLES